MSATIEPLPQTGPRADETRSLPEIGGIEITGVDLSRPLSQERKDWLLHTLRAHPVIVFRDQSLSKDQQYEFTLTFGEIEGTHVNRLVDPVMWDNRCTLHRALPHEDMDKERCVLHRTVVKGTVPY